MLNLLIEAFVVGVVFTVVILILNSVFGFNNDLTKLAILGFFSAVITHFLFELLGANKWYCDNGVACKLN